MCWALSLFERTDQHPPVTLFQDVCLLGIRAREERFASFLPSERRLPCPLSASSRPPEENLMDELADRKGNFEGMGKADLSRPFPLFFPKSYISLSVPHAIKHVS